MYKYKNKLTVKKGMKRFVARRSRVIRNNMDVDGGMIKCECYDQININSGATSPILFLSSSTYVNLNTMLANSASYLALILSTSGFKSCNNSDLEYPPLSIILSSV